MSKFLRGKTCWDAEDHDEIFINVDSISVIKHIVREEDKKEITRVWFDRLVSYDSELYEQTYNDLEKDSIVIGDLEDFF